MVRDDDHDDMEPVRPGSISPELIRVGLTLALFLILPALLLLFLLPRGSPEFAISLVTLVIGGVLLGFVGFLYWLATRL
jgi:hypothetical protein